MRLFIRICCAFIVSAMVTALDLFLGIGLGFIPTFIIWALCFWYSDKLCYYYDVNKFIKEAKKNNITASEYLYKRYNRALIDTCKSKGNNKRELTKFLQESEKSEVISKSDVSVLTYFCTDQK